MALRVIIADDEAIARERLRKLIEKEHDLEIVAECENGRTALAAILKLTPDVVFLDVQMPELNGLEVIRGLPPQVLPTIIFVTAYNHYAVEAFAVSAADYLLKPFDHARFQIALQSGRERVLRQRKLQEKASGGEIPALEHGRLAVRSSGRITLLAIPQIEWIQGARNYAELHVKKQAYLLRQTLTSLQRKLPPHFVRISKSHIVNTRVIRALKRKSHGDCIVILQDGTELVVSRKRRLMLNKTLSI